MVHAPPHLSSFPRTVVISTVDEAAVALCLWVLLTPLLHGWLSLALGVTR